MNRPCDAPWRRGHGERARDHKEMPPAPARPPLERRRASWARGGRTGDFWGYALAARNAFAVATQLARRSAICSGVDSDSAHMVAAPRPYIVAAMIVTT